MIVYLTIIGRAPIHLFCQHESKVFDKGFIQRTINGADHLRPGMAVVPDHLLLNAFRFCPSLKKIHRCLQGNLCTFHKAGKEHFLCHSAGHLCPVWVKNLFLINRFFTQAFTGRNHFLRQYIPVRHSHCIVQRKDSSLRFSPLQQFRPEGVNRIVQRQFEEHLLTGKVMILKICQELFFVHSHPSFLLSRVSCLIDPAGSVK